MDTTIRLIFGDQSTLQSVERRWTQVPRVGDWVRIDQGPDSPEVRGSVIIVRWIDDGSQLYVLVELE